jgi:DNA-binding beta-propeller fold protein YncE
MHKHTQAATALVAAAVAVLATGGIAQAVGAPRNTPQQPKNVTVSTQKVISLPGVGGHGDVVTVDRAAHTAYIAQSPDNDVIVLDTTSNTIKTVIPNIPSANGIAYTADNVFVASASTNSVDVISKATWKIIATVAAGGTTPDAIYVDPYKHSVFVANDGSSNMEEFSATAPFAVRGTLDLPPSPNGTHTGPDLGTYVAAGDRLYQAVDNQVLVIDPRTDTITHTFALPSAAGSAKDMYYDARRHLLWVATSTPEVFALNPSTGSIVDTVKTLSGADQIAGDPGDGLLFLGEGQAGVMGVIDLASHKNIANIPTESGFHTLAYLPHTGVVYAYYNQSNTVHVDKITTK